jgi:hypothetical protein
MVTLRICIREPLRQILGWDILCVTEVFYYFPKYLNANSWIILSLSNDFFIPSHSLVILPFDAI